MKDGTFPELAKSLTLLQMEILSRTNLEHLIDLVDKDRLFLLLLFIFLEFICSAGECNQGLGYVRQASYP